jgi:hypothetical protein
LAIVAPDAHASGAVVTIALPREVSSPAIGAQLRNAGYLLSYNSGYLLQRNWIQICLMGEWSQAHLEALPEIIVGVCQRHSSRENAPSLQPVAG